jgi:hypothetical protein
VVNGCAHAGNYARAIHGQAGWSCPIASVSLYERDGRPPIWFESVGPPPITQSIATPENVHAPPPPWSIACHPGYGELTSCRQASPHSRLAFNPATVAHIGSVGSIGTFGTFGGHSPPAFSRVKGVQVRYKVVSRFPSVSCPQSAYLQGYQSQLLA